MVAEKVSKRGGYREADQHEKAYQVQKGVFMFGKSSSRKEGSKRSKHVRVEIVGWEGCSFGEGRFQYTPVIHETTMKYLSETTCVYHDFQTC